MFTSEIKSIYKVLLMESKGTMMEAGKSRISSEFLY